MLKVMNNDQLVYKVVIWAFFGISLWTEKVTLILMAIIRAESCLIPMAYGLIYHLWVGFYVQAAENSS